MEFHSRGGGGTGPQGPIPKKKIQQKNPEKLGRGPKFPHGEPRSSYVLNLGLRLQTHGEAWMWVRGQNAGGRVWRTSSLALPLCVALVFLVVQAALLQGAYSHTEKEMHGQRMRHKIASREGRAFQVFFGYISHR